MLSEETSRSCDTEHVTAFHEAFACSHLRQVWDPGVRWRAWGCGKADTPDPACELHNLGHMAHPSPHGPTSSGALRIK